MVLGLHGNEVLFSLIAPFLFSDDLPLVAAINQLTWQQQLSRTEHIKKYFERWQDWATDLRHEEWCKFENSLALLGFRPLWPKETHMIEIYLSNHFPEIPRDRHLYAFLSHNYNSP